MVYGASTLLRFGALSNKTYTVQYTDDLAGGRWSKLKDVAARTAVRIEEVTDPGASVHRCYRLVTPWQP